MRSMIKEEQSFEPPNKSAVRKWLPALLVLFAVLAVLYSTLLPLKFGPDEPAHFIYIRTLATKFHVPPIAHYVTSSEDSVESHEAHQPPLFYGTMAVPYAVLNAAGVPSDSIWRVLRFLNILVGILWIWMVYRLALAFFRDEKKALFTTAFVAFIPTSAYQAGVLSNDILESLLFTWALGLLLPVFRGENAGIRGSAWRGAIIGLAVLTKAQGLALILMELVALALVARRTHRERFGEQLRETGVALAVCLVVCGWWFIRCKLVVGTAFPHSLFDPIVKPGMLSLQAFVAYPGEASYVVLRTIVNCTKLTIGFFWTPFWLVETVWLWRVYLNTIYALHVIVLVSLVAAMVRNRGEWRRSLMFVLLAPLLVYASYIHYLFNVDSGAGMQGRLFLPVACVLGICTVAASGVLKSEKAGNVLLAVVTAGMLGFNVWFMVTAVTNYIPVR